MSKRIKVTAVQSNFNVRLQCPQLCTITRTVWLPLQARVYSLHCLLWEGQTDLLNVFRYTGASEHDYEFPPVLLFMLNGRTKLLILNRLLQRSREKLQQLHWIQIQMNLNKGTNNVFFLKKVNTYSKTKDNQQNSDRQATIRQQISL